MLPPSCAQDRIRARSSQFQDILQVDGHGGYRAFAERAAMPSCGTVHVCSTALSVAGATQLR